MDEHERTKMCLAHDQSITRVETEVETLTGEKEAIVARLQLLVDQYHSQNVLFERLSGDIRALSVEVQTLAHNIRENGVTKAEFHTLEERLFALRKIVYWIAGVWGTVATGIIVKLFER